MIEVSFIVAAVDCAGALIGDGGSLLSDFFEWRVGLWLRPGGFDGGDRRLVGWINRESEQEKRRVDAAYVVRSPFVIRAREVTLRLRSVVMRFTNSRSEGCGKRYQ